MSTTTAGGGPDGPLAGKVALVAGATRGAGRAIAVELGRAGATVYATGRTTRERVSEVGRTTETIEGTAELIDAAGGRGVAVAADHLEPEQVRAVVDRIEREQGRLDVLVNDVWGGEHLVTFGKRTWETDLAGGLRMLRLGVETHLVTSSIALPLLVREPGGLVVEVTDGTAETNRGLRENLFYDLAKFAPIRMALGLGEELRELGGTAVSVTPGFLRSEQMLENFGVTEENWRDAVAHQPLFAIAESPVYVGRAVAALATDPERSRWNGRSLSSGELAREYGFTDADGSRPDAWAYLAAVDASSADQVDASAYR
ncbi:SDR family oxidoreductase [Streptomyces sp. JJ36]|uniref:SDR family oxidoreductase n=1 Tax=Streptomyces sp. JJ36 TaxID=2736645 RepID=UPI001F34270A|nr:SDR family oxidoreductase [Streptomyces sp. JJ36]MCF6522244.1 SDR family oxidoreductase [Streptomyces sp. JJ36]